MRDFDLDLSMVTCEHFITGKAAINFPRPHITSGGWHYLAYWNGGVDEAKVSLAGIHYPDTTFCFGDTGILNATDELERRGWKTDHQIYMADHLRATGDMVLKWGLGRSEFCNVELSEWFPDDHDLDAMVGMLKGAINKLENVQGDRLSRWLGSQLL
ncbi:hypothetical protein [Pseudomonas fluorescens]|uniref:Uncharacterized protein n=1 Tax=Pseudomonas fluorescens TaxID=294 RepID=A0A5E7HND1_PSEFL|nr:hypothetical protein [Pseudomonas fluorescens]VVO63877.1 hypothetical protein PS847_00945 [Pseudomonas fluorescens]